MASTFSPKSWTRSRLRHVPGAAKKSVYELIKSVRYAWTLSTYGELHERARTLGFDRSA